ncbi:Zn(II)2Cys6 transcription factor [Aspergillus lucknowensis]|uniref:Xylanolytic transcriptional activator regulatory domain-containing protein n=1 Tax=Aspergillus lucknowensis TaxID=176173 RepID=A0ABR4LRT9_9EURO
MTETDNPPPLRALVACVACNKKKVRCIIDQSGRKCQNCLRHQWPCLQRQPKRRGRHPGTGSRDKPEKRQRMDTIVTSSPSHRSASPHGGTTQEISPPATTTSGTSAVPGDELNGGPMPMATTAKENDNPYSSITAHCGYMERNDYFRDEESIHHDEGAPLPIPEAEIPTYDDEQLLRLQRAFDMPPRAIRESLIDTFMTRCAPWMPIVERSWLQDTGNDRPSLLLLQSVFLAASRVTSAPVVTAYASSHEFYRRAKALFWSGWEKNPLTVIAAVCILHWYNPECPEHVSTNTSSFWRYVGVGLAHQIGLHKEPAGKDGRALRRRLWWSLFARDCLISAGQGRPLAVNLCDSELKPPCVEDFRGSALRPDLFIAYVEICSILGHLTQCCRRDSLTRRTRQSGGMSLQRWIRGLPEPLRMFRGFESCGQTSTRQLHIPYFICLIILCRAPSTHHPPSAASILASSYVVGIFEDFLARDEVQFLGSIFTFYLLAAGIGLLSCRRVPTLWAKRESDMQTIYSSLEQLAKRWPSAMAPIRVLRSIAAEQHRSRFAECAPAQVPKLPADQMPFFDTFGPGLTSAWADFMPPDSRHGHPAVEDIGSTGHLAEPGVPTTMLSLPRGEHSSQFPDDTQGSNGLLPFGDFSGLHAQQAPLDEGFSHMEYEGIGDWLLNDCDIYGDVAA